MMKQNCQWLNDVECSYAPGYEICEGCDKYKKDDRKHPLDDSDRVVMNFTLNKIWEKKND